MKKISSKKITTLAILTGISLVMFIVENLFPPLFLPGAKMGLSNIVTLFSVLMLSPFSALIIVVLRTVLGSLIVGSLSTLMYSLTAGLVACLTSILLYKMFFPKISIIAISAVSAVGHNITQSLVFCLVTQSLAFLAYMPYLALLGAVAGVVVGFAVGFILKKLPDTLYQKIGDL